MQVSTATASAASASSTSNSANSSSISANNMVNYNQFLQLLVAQLKNQDPTNPSDSTQFLSQLASFSGVEQQVQTNQKLNSLLTSTNLTQAESLIGRSVTSSDGTTHGKVVSVSMQSGALTASLDNGSSLPITSDVKISA